MPVMIDQEKCDGCETCVDVCPTEAIAIADGKAQVDEDECNDCGVCEIECSNEAIALRED